MKTTVDIADGLLDRAKRAAAERGTTLRALVEEGLDHVLDDHEPAGSFRLRDASVDGSGAAAWHAMSDDERVAAMYPGG